MPGGVAAVAAAESRARSGVLLNATRADNELRAAFEGLVSPRNGDGGWPWFPGGRSCDPVTLAIIAGFGFYARRPAVDAAAEANAFE